MCLCKNPWSLTSHFWVVLSFNGPLKVDMNEIFQRFLSFSSHPWRNIWFGSLLRYICMYTYAYIHAYFMKFMKNSPKKILILRHFTLFFRGHFVCKHTAKEYSFAVFSVKKYSFVVFSRMDIISRFLSRKNSLTKP